MNARDKTPKGDVIIDPPSDTLKKKAPPSKVDLDAALKKAVAAVDKIGLEYPKFLARDCASLRQMTAEFKQTLAKPVMDNIRFLAHDMKGQGGQFGYPLVTAICDSLQKYLAPIEAPDVRTAEIVGIYVDAVLLVESRKMTGEGGEAGKVLLASLSKLSD
ncbi:MAG: Hpt domain-containing protein [Alphaproteobacteria bacterium]|nr:Hpt domain-containing protein [Alphaproteobacteria bacterium]